MGDLSCDDEDSLWSTDGEEEVPTGGGDLKEIVDLIKMNPYASMCHRVNDFYKAQQERKLNKARKRKVDADEEEKVAANIEDTPNLASIITDDDREELAVWYEEIKMSVVFCFNIKRACLVKKCRCFTSLDTDVAVNLLVYLSSLHRGKRETLYKQFLAASQKKNRAVIDVPHLQIHNKKLCCTSLRNILAINQRLYARLNKDLENGVTGPCSNGRIGNKNRSKNSLAVQCKPDVMQWISKYGQQYGSKRRVYSAYVYSQGWQMPKATQKGSYGSTSNYKKRKDDPNDVEWDQDVEPTPVCSYSVFLNIWQQECPLVIIHPKPKETGGDGFKSPDSNDGKLSGSRKRNNQPAASAESERDPISLGNRNKVTVSKRQQQQQQQLLQQQQQQQQDMEWIESQQRFLNSDGQQQRTRHCVPLFPSRDSMHGRITTSATCTLPPCVICHRGKRTHIATPCMHFSFCATCAIRLSDQGPRDCPVCNQPQVSFAAVSV
ncbi:hypothetical protein ACA910_012695 [Epithemia clementina (nom. ined.)]